MKVEWKKVMFMSAIRKVARVVVCSFSGNSDLNFVVWDSIGHTSF
jgi:hypothetical protein